jgi:hypothetical protein
MECDYEGPSFRGYFRSPELTPALVATIKRVAPHLDADTSEQFRTIWERDQNGSCRGEYEALAPFLNRLSPKRILEIGPGLGRSLIYFSKALGWHCSLIHAFEGNGDSIRYPILGPRSSDSYCGNITGLKRVLEFNHVKNVTIFDAASYALRALPGPYDLIYSFYSIGFHWAIEYFIEDLLPLIHFETVLVFTTPLNFVSPHQLSDFHHKIIRWRTVTPSKPYLSLLLLSRSKRFLF